VESVGELSVVDVDDDDDESDEDDESVVVAVDVSDESCAYAATPTATVPATLAATNAPVISDVRRSPVSRFMPGTPLG